MISGIYSNQSNNTRILAKTPDEESVVKQQLGVKISFIDATLVVKARRSYSL